MKTTTNLGLPLSPVGPIETQQAFDKAMNTIDEAIGDPDSYIKVPAPTSDDIGKVLGVEDDGDGNPVVAWVEIESDGGVE